MHHDKRWLIGALAIWVIAMLGIVALVFYFHRRSQDILVSLVANDPSAARQALLLRLQADRLVNEALLKDEAATGGSAETRTSATVLISEVVPLLEEAEGLYLKSLDANSSQPGVLFHLVEVNSLMGRRDRAALFLSRFLESQGEAETVPVFGENAGGLEPPPGRTSDASPTTTLR